jgi:hypothetical protein
MRAGQRTAHDVKEGRAARRLHAPLRTAPLCGLCHLRRHTMLLPRTWTAGALWTSGEREADC